MGNQVDVSLFLAHHAMSPFIVSGTMFFSFSFSLARPMSLIGSSYSSLNPTSLITSVVIKTSSRIITSFIYLCVIERCLLNFFGEITLVHINNHVDFTSGLDSDLLHGNKVVVHFVGVFSINHKIFQFIKV